MATSTPPPSPESPSPSCSGVSWRSRWAQRLWWLISALSGTLEIEADQERNRADRERNRAAQAREQAARRSQLQDGCLVAQCRFLLADTARNRLQPSEALAVLMEA